MNIFKNFFSWYKRNYKINLYVIAGLFIWQLVHLYWMTADIVMLRVFGHEFWHVGKIGNLIISVVDYTEIPALILGSIFYMQELQRKWMWKAFIFLLILNSQWLHLFWITDEVVFAQITGTALFALPLWLSWLAIIIDYLELPVIYDTLKKATKSALSSVG